jgi:hypothetical protein
MSERRSALTGIETPLIILEIRPLKGRTPLWRNGRRSALKMRRRKAWRFDSSRGDPGLLRCSMPDEQLLDGRVTFQAAGVDETFAGLAD